MNYVSPDFFGILIWLNILNKNFIINIFYWNADCYTIFLFPLGWRWHLQKSLNVFTLLQVLLRLLRLPTTLSLGWPLVPHIHFLTNNFIFKIFPFCLFFSFFTPPFSRRRHPTSVNQTNNFSHLNLLTFSSIISSSLKIKWDWILFFKYAMHQEKRIICMILIYVKDKCFSFPSRKWSHPFYLTKGGKLAIGGTNVVDKERK